MVSASKLAKKKRNEYMKKYRARKKMGLVGMPKHEIGEDCRETCDKELEEYKNPTFFQKFKNFFGIK